MRQRAKKRALSQARASSETRPEQLDIRQSRKDIQALARIELPKLMIGAANRQLVEDVKRMAQVMLAMGERESAQWIH